MFSYSIIPLDTEHLQEICADIRRQYETGAADLALFSMKIEPIGNPLIDRVGVLIDRYVKFRDELAKSGHKCGILVQATMGHGSTLDDKLAFQPYVNINGEIHHYVSCPYDPDFIDYMRSSMERLAALSPELIMVDDDYRMLAGSSRRGCACRFHLAEFNRRADTSFTREELFAELSEKSEKSKALGRIFGEIQDDSLFAAAKAMREGIDRVNPKIQGAFCVCGDDSAGEIARILAGEGNPSILRVNNGNYAASGIPRGLTTSFARMAIQSSYDKNKADIYLAETDTFPRNRYAKSATSLHAHYTGTIMEGASGAKHFITRLRQFEPSSGRAYRDMLAKHSGFYKALADIVKEIKWLGACIPTPGRQEYSPSPESYGFNWSTEVLERLGLPMYFSRSPGNLVFLGDNNPKFFTDEELAEFFKGHVVLSASAAKQLEARGLANLLGVSLGEFEARMPTGEIICKSNIRTELQPLINKLTVVDASVEIGSYSCNFNEVKGTERLCPSSTVYENPLGGRTTVFAGSPSPSRWENRFSYLNESRKLQFIEIFEKSGCLPIYYPGDAEVYLRAGALPDGALLVAFFNLGLDPIENIELTSKRNFTSIELLGCDGDCPPIDFTHENDSYRLEAAAPTGMPQVLILH